MAKPAREAKQQPEQSIAEMVLELERLYPGGGDVEIPAAIWRSWVERARKEVADGR